MFQRALEPHLRRLAGPFPVVFLTGPRQSGKTTLARLVFPQFEYVSLEDLQTREEAVEDPRGFLARFEGSVGLILDEAQRAPALFSYIQGYVDERRLGPIVLTGSQHFLLSEQINQSLAGRAAVLELLPLSYAELTSRKSSCLDEFMAGKPPAAHEGSGRRLDDVLLSGLYPRIHDQGLEPGVWLDSYIRTYIERDVRTLTNVGDLSTFTRFTKLCAGRAGQLLNMTALGADAGVDQTTVKRWLSVLTASYIVDVLPPHQASFRKRLIKTPKLVFHDTGVLCSLLGIRTVEQLRIHPLRGAIFENFVIAEARKLFLNCAENPPLSFFRDSRGLEVDLIVERGGKLLPVEIKSGQTVASDFFTNLDAYCGLSGADRGILVYGGESTYERRAHLVCSWADWA